MKIRGARFEHLREPLGIGTGTPRISWRICRAVRRLSAPIASCTSSSADTSIMCWG